MAVAIRSRAALASLGCIRPPVICSSAFHSVNILSNSLHLNHFSLRFITTCGLLPPVVAANAAVNPPKPSSVSLKNRNQQIRNAHKFAAPDCPNLLKLREAVERNFQPICFFVKNDYAMGHHVYDQHFYVGEAGSKAQK